MRLVIFLLLLLPLSLTSQNWESIGGGTNHIIQTYFSDTEGGYLYAGGNFRIAGGNTVNCLARWDGIEWHPLGEGIQPTCDICGCSPVYAITKFQNNIYASGVFKFSNLFSSEWVFARWDEEQWDSITTTSSTIWGFYPTDDSLFAFGTFDTIANINSSKIARWDGVDWHAIDTTQWKGHGIYTMAIYQGEIYIGGNFYNEDHSIRGLAKWDGEQWVSPGPPLVGSFSWVREMLVYKGELYIAGIFSKAEGNTGNAIIRWDGQTQREVGEGVYGYNYNQIWDMVLHDDKICIVGDFPIAGGISAQNIALWDGQQWCSLGSHFDNIVFHVADFRDTVHISMGAGGIDDIEHVNFCARWLGGDYVDTCSEIVSSSHEADQQAFHLSISPNPASQTLYLQTNCSGKGEGLILNAQGQVVQRFTADGSGATMEVAVGHLPGGVYWVRWKSRDCDLVEKVVIF